MPHATVDTLPPEITDRIIGILHSDKTTLLACSLVCRSWLPASRYYLFERLSLSPSRNVERFQEPIDRSVISTIAPYVRQFDILENDRLKWVNTVLPHLDLADFKDVKSLLLSNMNYNSDPSAGATLHALGAWFPEVTRLRLDTVFFDNFPRVLEFICMFPLLEEVHLENVRVKDDGPTFEPSPDRSNPLPRLRSLCLENKDVLIKLWNWCRFYGNFPSVDRLSLVALKGETSAIAELLEDLGSSLKRFDIGFEFEEDYAVGLDLHLNTELSAIHLLLPRTDEDVGPIALAVPMLSKFICLSLREMTFSIQLSLEQCAQADAWFRLDEVLSKPEFQGLKVITFRLFDVHGCVFPQGHIDKAATEIRTWLPNCGARSMFHSD